MVIKDGLNKIQLMMVLAAILMLCLGCGTDDESIVEPETPVEPDTSTGKPDLVTATGSLKGSIERIDGISVTVRVLQNGNVIASIRWWRGVAGTTQTEQNGNISTITADADGNYQIGNIVPGTYTVEIVAQGYEAVEKTVQVSADGVVSLDRVTLKALGIPVSHIQGILSDQKSGNPLNKVPVRLVDPAGNSREVLTTQTGAFEFENVPTDQRFTVTVDLEGFEQQEISIDPIPAGETVPLEVALIALPGIRGLVLDQITKTPLIGVRVQLSDEVGNVLETPTTTSGVFEFKGVAANQKLTITIDSDEYEKQEFTVDPIPVGETVKLQVELIPLNPDQLPDGDGLAVGLKAPDFNLPDSDGEMIALADYAGKKKVVLVFDRGQW